MIEKISFKLIDEENSYSSILELSKTVLEKRNNHYSSNPQNQELLDLIFRNCKKNDYSNSFSLNINPQSHYSLVNIWLYSPFEPKQVKIVIHFNITEKVEYHVPVFQIKQNNHYSFPVKGSSYILYGSDLRSSNHKMFDLQSNGIDVVKISNTGKIYNNDFLQLQNHEIFNEEVYSAYKGTVIEVQDKYEDAFNVDKIINSNLLLTLMQHRKKRYEILNEDENKKMKSLLGNFVLIKHEKEYSLYAHLKKNSIEVKEKQNVDTGEKIARIGNSGSSIFPHLHFQVMNRRDIFNSSTIPIVFQNITGHIFPINRTLFTGDLIKTF